MKQKLFFLFTIIICNSYLLQAQPAPAIEWQKSFGGSANDVAPSIQQTVDGGYIVAGYSNSSDGDATGSHGGNDFWIIKLNSAGNIEWKKRLGNDVNEQAWCITQTSDGGYITVGYANGYLGSIHGMYNDYWIIKLDNTGNVEWQNKLGGTWFETATSVQQTKDGGYIVAGSAVSGDGDVNDHHGTELNDDYWIIKLSNTGTIEWTKTLGGSNEDDAWAISQTTDGGYIAGGYSNSSDGDVSGNHGNYDCWIVKLNNLGTMEWEKSFGGSSAEYPTGFDGKLSMQQTSDGGYIIAADSKSSDGDVTGSHSSAGNCWIVKLSTTGSIQWQRSLGGSYSDGANSIQQTFDGGYIIAGHSTSVDGDLTGNLGSNDFWIIKLSSAGNIQWTKSIGGSLSEEAICIQQTKDSGYIAAGYSYSNDVDVTGNHGNADFWIVKLGPDNFNPVYTFTGTGNWDIAANWSGNVVPPSIIPAGTQIIIKPQPGGECILNVPETVSNGASLWVVPGAVFKASANLNILQ